MSDLATTVTVIDACGASGVAVLLWSDPGLGKSSLVRGLAAAQGLPCEVVLGSIREPADVAGLPVVRGDGSVVLSPPSWAVRLADAAAGYVLLDELSTCPPAVQAALLAVALDRVVGDLALPSGVRVLAAANPADRAADGWELSPPLANRFCHVSFTPSVDEWLDGMTVGWSAPPASRAITADPVRVAAVKALVTGFIRHMPEHLHAFPVAAAASGGAWPSRRTWAMLSAALANVRDEDAAARQAITFGLVGEGVGVEFLTWCAAADLPDPAAVVDDPSLMDWDGRPDRVWAVLSSVVGWAASQGTVSAWQSAWRPLLAAADGGSVDVAAAAARPLSLCRPASARVPAAVRTRFAPVLAAAGLGTAA
ncbi:AAA family ATPase [Propionicimonas sp.]|uniref:AAA family ATPase n=1 Tax=Propionicimonas sp. TaxID=1955623 RepID=UPI0017CA8CA8|nr:AAA family ATPase [Propionicimonas sp.]MBA3019614.1 AAA family ATPase [Propionicimonas sp.]MBU4208041.1 AAA family ATPase [Actinomycetota bacterium]MBU4411505.1 AAA family ATPase [Actinomycetota bacterium]MCG2805733.1 AAA family ATPase [Propionicimonas sp.]